MGEIWARYGRDVVEMRPCVAACSAAAERWAAAAIAEMYGRYSGDARAMCVAAGGGERTAGPCCRQSHSAEKSCSRAW